MESLIGARRTEPEGGRAEPEGGRVDPDTGRTDPDGGLESEPSKC